MESLCSLMPSMAGDDMALGAVDTKDTLSLSNTSGFLLLVALLRRSQLSVSMMPPGVCVRLQHTGLVDGRHLNSTGGQRGLGFEPVPFKRRHWGEEVVLVPAVLSGPEKSGACSKRLEQLLSVISLSFRGYLEKAQRAACVQKFGFLSFLHNFSPLQIYVIM